MNDWNAFADLLDPTQMARADSLTIARGLSGSMLMERAGRAVAAEAARLVLAGSRRTPRIVVLCGPGNNGGDGFVAARDLASRGFPVVVCLLGSRDSLKGDAGAAATAWDGDISPIESFDPAGFDLVVDALFGAGLARDLDGTALAAVGKVNDWRRRGGKVLAVDVPSGLDGATGRVRGAAVQADATVTFFRLKPGHVLLPGRRLCGDLRLVQIGIDESVLPDIGTVTFLNIPRLWRRSLPEPSIEGHKYTRGHAVVLSGPATKTGAARLAARGALRVGAGLVTLAAPADAGPELAAHLTSIMLTACASPLDLVRLLDDPRKNAIVAGPGLGTDAAAHERLAAALRPCRGRATVLDADAITLVAADLSLPRGQRQGGGPLIMTPHDGEFSRLVRSLRRDVESVRELSDSMSQAPLSKLEGARRVAEALDAHIVLKGPDTVVAAPDGRAAIAANLPPDLATAGSGDVLAGMIGGLLAQGMPAWEACCAAVWLHGEAATAVGRGLISEDIPEALSAVLCRLNEGE